MGPFSRSPRNVILISVESLSAEFLGAYGSKKGLTPNLDRLAAEGLKFEHAYATGTRTVRGLEALSLGTPPIPGQAILRRPNNDHLTTIGQFLKYQGFVPYFIYGGYGYFDNMNAFFEANDYAVLDRVDFPKDSIPFENVWGVADEALFGNALRILDAPSSARAALLRAHHDHQQSPAVHLSRAGASTFLRRVDAMGRSSTPTSRSGNSSRRRARSRGSRTRSS